MNYSINPYSNQHEDLNENEEFLVECNKRIEFIFDWELAVEKFENVKC